MIWPACNESILNKCFYCVMIEKLPDTRLVVYMVKYADRFADAIFMGNHGEVSIKQRVKISDYI